MHMAVGSSTRMRGIIAGSVRAHGLTEASEAMSSARGKRAMGTPVQEQFLVVLYR